MSVSVLGGGEGGYLLVVRYVRRLQNLSAQPLYPSLSMLLLSIFRCFDNVRILYSVILFFFLSVFAFGRSYSVLFIARALQGVGSSCSSVSGKRDLRSSCSSVSGKRDLRPSCSSVSGEIDLRPS